MRRLQVRDVLWLFYINIQKDIYFVEKKTFEVGSPPLSPILSSQPCRRGFTSYLEGSFNCIKGLKLVHHSCPFHTFIIIIVVIIIILLLRIKRQVQ